MRLVALVLLLAACPPPSKYAVERPGLDCDRANRVAHKTLVAMGYSVTQLVPATAVRSGVVAGTKTGSDGEQHTGRVVIQCSSGGAVLQPVEDTLVPDYEFSRAFGYSFKGLVQRPDVETPWKSAGLQVLVQTVDAFQSRLDLGDVATEGGNVAIRVTIRNDTDRKVRLDPARLSLVDGGGNSREPLAGAALAAAIAKNGAGEKLRDDLFGTDPIGGGESRVGFLVYPPGRYREARVAIEDVETEETEGFVTPVQ